MRYPFRSTSKAKTLLAITCIVIMAICFVVLSRTTVSTPFKGTTAAAASADDQENRGPGRMRGCARCATPGNFEIYAPLLALPEARSTELVFNSRSPQTMAVTPIFYKLDGRRIVGEPVMIESAEIRYVDVKKLLPPTYREDRDWGGLSLAYHGVAREMWAQLRFLGVNGGGNVDEFFIVKAEARSDVQQAVWWTPPKSTSIIALGNVTNQPSGALVTFGDGESQAVQLAPNGTAIIRRENTTAVESVAIEMTGLPGSIIPTGVIASKDGSFNSVIRFYDTKNAKQQHMFANGLRLGGVTPHLVLKNTSGAPIVAQPTVISVGGVSAREPILLPAVNLAANEAREVDLSGIGQKRGFDVVCLKVTSSGDPGSLIGSIHGIQDETGLSYDTPLRDTGPVRAMTGSYPWKIANDFTTIIYITNVSDQEAEFTGEINYRGGRVIVAPRELQPGETSVFDMRKLRGETKDSNGHHVSRTATFGQFKWSVRGVTNGKHLLIGRAEMVSRSQLISTSYSCTDPCPPWYGATLTPVPLPTVFLNATGSATMTEIAFYDSGYQAGPYPVYTSWSLSSAIATLSPENSETTTMTGQTVGGATLDGFVGIQQRYGWDGLNCLEYGTYEERDVGPAEVQCQKPTGETSAPDVWGEGVLATVHMWKQTLTGPGNFTGREILEQEGNPPTISDSCFFEGSEISKYKISGLQATVTEGNQWKPDAVGFPTGAVTFYRNQGRAPCTATATQVMFITCQPTLSQYATGNLVVGITATQVSSKRHGAATQTKTWP
jgi:hypothetical protein